VAHRGLHRFAPADQSPIVLRHLRPVRRSVSRRLRRARAIGVLRSRVVRRVNRNASPFGIADAASSPVTRGPSHRGGRRLRPSECVPVGRRCRRFGRTGRGRRAGRHGWIGRTRWNGRDGLVKWGGVRAERKFRCRRGRAGRRNRGFRRERRCGRLFRLLGRHLVRSSRSLSGIGWLRQLRRFGRRRGRNRSAGRWRRGSGAARRQIQRRAWRDGGPRAGRTLVSAGTARQMNRQFRPVSGPLGRHGTLAKASVPKFDPLKSAAILITGRPVAGRRDGGRVSAAPHEYVGVPVQPTAAVVV
jgi:hypothetical protein